jgi:NAD(P)-dependent dehydrogenase (short-subunit alcohol dehydrogenase family)
VLGLTVLRGGVSLSLLAGVALSNLRTARTGSQLNQSIRTRNGDRREGGADRLRHLYPLGRVGEPEDVAAAVAFLASSDAAWITGQKHSEFMRTRTLIGPCWVAPDG